MEELKQVACFKAVRAYAQELLDRGYSYSEMNQLVNYVCQEAKSSSELHFSYMKRTSKHMKTQK